MLEARQVLWVYLPMQAVKHVQNTTANSLESPSFITGHKYCLLGRQKNQSEHRFVPSTEEVLTVYFLSVHSCLIMILGRVASCKALKQHGLL
jgi:hypothetical protein